MNDIRLKRSVGKSAVASWVAATATAGFLFGSTQSFAAMPAANSVIGNQATASYVDSTNATQVASSNLVQTTVQQVGALTLTADSSASGAAGSTVYVAHTLTNSGNGSDVFKIEAASTTNVTPEVTPILYLDADGNGQPDSTTPMVATQTIAGGASLKFVVAYTIPTTAASDWSRTAEVKVTAGTTTTQTLYTTYVASNIDTIKFTDAAAFAVTMSLTTPTVSAASGHPWNTAKYTGKVGSGAVYTLTYVNNGAAAGSLYIKDVVPAGFVDEQGSAVWSSLPGTALNEAGTLVQVGNGANITYKYDTTTKTIEAWISNVNQNVTGTISFNVAVASTATIGIADTQNSASYNSTACSVLPTDLATAATNCTALTSSNVSTFTVTGTYAPKFGALDTALGTPNSVGDEVVLNASGSVAYFPQTVTNNGNAVDTFNLKYNYSTFINTFPSGTTFTWLSANKTTALIDTNGDGVVDTGPIDAGKSLDVVLQVVLPDGTANVANATYQVEPEARSVNDSTQYDLFIATLSTTPAYKFSVTPSNTGQVTAGGSVTYSHTIANSGSYSCFADGNFRVNVTGLPTGWTAAVYIDNNSDGAIDSSDTLVTSTGASGSFALPSTLGGKLSSAASFKILVRIFAASGATVGEQASVTVEVTDISTTNTACTLGSQSPSDVTSVVTGQVRVLKKHVLDTACDGTPVAFVGTPLSVKPGECVIYDVTATNEGTTVIDNLVVTDAVPNYTTYTGTPVGEPGSQPPVATQCYATGLAAGSVDFLKSGLTLTCGGTNQVNPGGTVTMRYSIKLNTN